jgi:hypothetical protein
MVRYQIEGIFSVNQESYQLGPPEKAATTAGQQRWLIASL